MEEEFRLTIRLGNDAVQTGDDIAHLLEKVAGNIRDYGDLDHHATSILDQNGNRVGQYKLASQ